MRRLLLVPLVLLVLALPRSSRAFCGFYVSDADQKLYSNATMVVLMRDGDRTVLSMQNNYQGPPEKFALVVPVPQVLHKENVRTLPLAVFDKVDRLASPRLVEYWEADPCATTLDTSGAGFGTGHGRLGGMGGGVTTEETVRVEARFEVGEYEIVILSASDSSGLDRWLRQEGYHIPDGAEPVLRPYVASGMKFFVAKVDPTKVTFENGQAMLSPLRFFYDTDKFTLPVRLGLLNSAGTQDLIIHILGKKQRYEVANYPNVTIPTNLDVSEAARARFPEFYAALFDATMARNPRAVVTEYSWSSGACDPCPSPPLDAADLATLGEDVVGGNDGGVITTVQAAAMTPTIRQRDVQVTGALPPEIVQRIVRQSFGRVRFCYEGALRTNPNLAGTLAARFVIRKDGSVSGVASDASSTIADPGLTACMLRMFSTLSFPQPEKGTVTVIYPIVLSAIPSASAGSWAPRGSSDIVLTRLHVRYAKDSLGEDLVFRTAGAIVGGRERRDGTGALEHGATQDSNNNFQARYAIRHAWAGPVACENPHRGVWGGPPGGGTPAPLAAQKLAFVPRGHLELASMVRQAVPELALLAAPVPPSAGGAADSPAPVGSASPPASETPAPPASASPPPARPTRSLCSASPGRVPPYGLGSFLSALVLALAVVRGRSGSMAK
jgi:hypothetical protein